MNRSFWVVCSRAAFGRIGCERLESLPSIPLDLGSADGERPALSRRVRKVVGYPPLSEMNELQRRELHEALLDADALEDLPGEWQAAIFKAEPNRPKLRLVSDTLVLSGRGPVSQPHGFEGRLSG